MNPRLRKFALTAHVSVSVGWLGAVIAFLALAIAGLNSSNIPLVRTSYIAMDVMAWFVILPAAIASLITGLIQSLGTHWGLLRHYWIIVKLFLTVAATALLLLHMQPISFMAGVANDLSFSGEEYTGRRIDLIVKSAAAILVLLAATTLSIYKPWGKTGYGIKKQQENNKINIKARSIPWGRFVLIGIFILLLLVVIKHIAGGGMGHH